MIRRLSSALGLGRVCTLALALLVSCIFAGPVLGFVTGAGSGYGVFGVADAAAWMIAVHDEPAGSHCTYGGANITQSGQTVYACNGAPGAAGATGPAGATGSTGATGAQGTQGIQGVPGTNGTNGTDAFQWYNGSCSGTLPTGSGSFVNNDMYLCSSGTSASLGKVFKRTAGAWVATGANITGPAGVAEALWGTSGSTAIGATSTLYIGAGVNVSASGAASTSVYFVSPTTITSTILRCKSSDALALTGGNLNFQLMLHPDGGGADSAVGNVCNLQQGSVASSISGSFALTAGSTYYMKVTNSAGSASGKGLAWSLSSQ